MTQAEIKRMVDMIFSQALDRYEKYLKSDKMYYFEGNHRFVTAVEKEIEGRPKRYLTKVLFQIIKYNEHQADFLSKFNKTDELSEIEKEMDKEIEINGMIDDVPTVIFELIASYNNKKMGWDIKIDNFNENFPPIYLFMTDDELVLTINNHPIMSPKNIRFEPYIKSIPFGNFAFSKWKYSSEKDNWLEILNKKHPIDVNPIIPL